MDTRYCSFIDHKATITNKIKQDTVKAKTFRAQKNIMKQPTWLLKNQKPDGSWYVKTRSRPIQKYFESGFPHGQDQFISISATCWAVLALTSSASEDTK